MSAFDKYIYRILTLATVLTIATGTVFYHIVEKLSYVDSYYFSVITLATVGFGDITPHTTLGKLFTTAYIFVGVGIITTYLSATARKRGERLKDRHEKYKQKRKE